MRHRWRERASALCVVFRMHIVEIFLPARGAALEAELSKLRVLLTEKFGGFTAFTRAPAHGAWRAPHTGRIEHDELIVVEVMTDALDRAWWSSLRGELESALEQKEILMRAHPVQKL
jgi:hypothetical protein